jgi:signal transduction histidine kinase/ligand-binding sensor domain-containing protein
MKKLPIYIFVLILLTDFVSAQKHNFKNYQVDDGLSLTQISYVFQASTGHLYLGTYGGGLNVFDGLKFKSFNTSSGLVDNSIYYIAEDENGIIWLATTRGLSSFDGLKFKNYFVEDGLLSNDIYSLKVVEGNKLLIGTTNGLSVYEISKNNFYEINLPKNIDHVPAVYANSINNILIGTYNGLYEITDGAAKRKFADVIDSTYSIRNILRDRKGVYWIATNKGLFKFVNDNFVRYTFEDGLSDNSILWISESSEGEYWISTEKGVNKFDGTDFKKYSSSNGFTDSKTWCIIEGREGIVWFATDMGLYSLKNQEFVLYDKFNGGVISPWALGFNGNKLLLGTDTKGVLSFEAGKISKIDQKHLNNKTIWSIKKDSQDRIWFGVDSGVVKYENGKYELFNEKEGFIEYGGVYSIFEDNGGRIWFGTGYNGVYYYSSGKFTHVQNTTGFEFETIFSIMQDSENKIWAGTERGLCKVQNDEMSYTEKFKELNGYTIISVLNKQNKMLIGTYEIGVLIYDLNSENETAVFDTINTEKGLNDNSVLLMIFDNFNDLWVGTNKGLNKIDLNLHDDNEEISILSFDKHDGIPGLETTQNAAVKDADGNLWFGVIDGIVKVDPSKVEPNWLEPLTSINDFQVIANQPRVEYKSVLNLVKKNSDDYFQIPFDNNSITIDYVGINFINPKSVQYRFRISGSDWSPLTSNTQVSYSSLSPGKYTFQVISKNKNNIWNFSPASVQFEIVAPFWRSIWFYVIVGVVVLLAIYGLYKLRVSTITRQNKELEERIKFRLKYEKELEKSERELLVAKEKAERSDALKSEFLAQMSHEIRTPVNSILNFSNLLKNEMIDKINNELKEGFSIIESGGRRLIRTIDSILNMSQIQTDSFEVFPTELDLNEILDNLIREFRNVADQKKIALKFLNEESIGKIKGDEYTITQLFANLIDNAIKYTNEGSITIEIKKDSDEFIVVNVTDTGVGISEEFQANLFQPFSQEETGYTRKFEGNGLGLALVKKYCELNNAKIFFSSKKGKGTTFTVVFMEVKEPVES